MKISAKSRYALAALIQMGQNNGVEKPITIASLSERLGISKIYLEQVFSLLKRGNIVKSTKGAHGGYQIARPMHEISIYDILLFIELSLFQQADQTVAEKASHIERVLQNDIFEKLDTVILKTLEKQTLDLLVEKAVQHEDDGYMYYI